ncbi:hypothetical protein [Roseovarius aestuariivivens]|uniref:hypothetical protein n=1 Tax=Roseovarius aestuariivivens TaxID=1888910 RepID=UPI00108024A3|nr:hypothetical protein [Roseovarius aestuariivivens]
MRSEKPFGNRPLADLVDCLPVRIRYAEGTGTDLVVSFSSIGQRRALMPDDEFTGTLLKAPDRHCLFVSDITRSWLSSRNVCDAVRQAVASVKASADIQRTSTLGLSMGGFSALVAANLFDVDTAIAISPQYSPLQTVMPTETRWRYWRRRITHSDFPTAESGLRPGHSFVFHGLLDDTAHASAFSQAAHLDHFVFPKATHALGQHLKKSGGLHKLVTAAINQDRRKVARLVRKNGGFWRQSQEALLVADAA